MEFIFQPNQDSRLGEYLLENLAGPWTCFRAAVAFIKRSGTRHIKQALSDFVHNSEVEIIAGIDHRGSSAAGLQDLLDAISPNGRVIVFHNRLPFTFHPKVYLFKSSQSADLLIGSGNLTEGGLFTNYEASFRLKLDLTQSDHASLLGSVERVLDSWSDTSRQTALLLDKKLLGRLAAMGRIPLLDQNVSEIEGLMSSSASLPESPSSDTEAEQKTGLDPFHFLFAAEGVPPAPKPPRTTLPGSGMAVVRAPETARRASTTESIALAATGFVMTLHRTDVGVGQTTPGASRRSPEIFVPLAARNANPDFWDWPAGFAEDPGKSGKLDRAGVRMRIGGEVVAVQMMTWPDKHDFRLRSEALRSAGDIGDVLRLEKVSSGADFDYYAEIIPQGTREHARYLALCGEQVRNSEKRYGYY
ncbi:MAG: hypothetical protein OXF66_03525 [Gammaproteobacteria bacterium]|nr:hypothetical protein [Gammaproteobacteria bacterium]MCY4165756.1 hypothetical protein [Gammaproteobacteria bacterium]